LADLEMDHFEPPRGAPFGSEIHRHRMERWHDRPHG
jgi:hypothetical protein